MDQEPILTTVLSVSKCALLRSLKSKMFGFKIIKMPLDIKLDTQYATKLPTLGEETQLAMR